MFFDTNISESYVGDVAPSKYEANLEGALMLVYENECNYNALIKAAALSELKYYRENGGELFVQEAGAFSGFLSKAKDFFKKVLEKIKALFKKFFMTISQYFMTDKEWVKKYEKDILRVTNLEDFSFKGYKFSRELDAFNGYTRSRLAGDVIDTIKNIDFDSAALISKIGNHEVKTEDDVNDIIEALYGELCLEGSPCTESEMRDNFKEKLYGDTTKEELDDKDINLREQINFIVDTKKSISGAEKVEKDATKLINDLIKALETAQKNHGKFDKAERTDQTLSDKKNDIIKFTNHCIKVAQAMGNAVTALSGIFCQALKDRNRQAKAICIKAVSYNNKKKNESFMYSDGNDLFANVNII